MPRLMSREWVSIVIRFITLVRVRARVRVRVRGRVRVRVGVRVRDVAEHVEGAVHRLELVVGALHLHLVEHPLLVKVEVARGLPQVHRRHVRRVPG